LDFLEKAMRAVKKTLRGIYDFFCRRLDGPYKG